MALRCIAQVAPAATTDTVIVDGSQVQPLHLRSLIVCERGAASALFRLWLRVQGAATATKQYLYYDLPVVPNDSFTLALDIGMLPGDILMTRVSTANVSVNLFSE
jgi:hypothetical protein